MEKASFSMVRPDVLNDNKMSIHAYLRQSYTHAKKHIQDGINIFKDELREIRDSAEACFDFLALPINNYLKDINQIDQDFQKGLEAETNNSSARIVNITEALTTQCYMEENY